MKLSFFGGAQSVTGANYLIEHGNTKIIVDCGLHQGSKYAEDLNYEKFAYDPASIDYVFITHTHIDHVGRLPKLFKDGFRGKVYVAVPSRELMSIALPDNMGHIINEAESEGHPPLFNQEDLNGLMDVVEEIEYDKTIKLDDGITAKLHDAGHVLGSAIVELEWTSSESGEIKKIFFSGDLGNPPTPLLHPTEFIHDANYIVIESAYGDRVHEERGERRSKLAKVIKDTINRGGTLMIPSFALERTQDLLVELHDLHMSGETPKIPIYLDSPLAIKLTGVYEKHVRNLHFSSVRMTMTLDESKKINNVPPPKIIIAGSGMSQGGRILHHEMRYLPDPKSTILFIGYQVDGSLGRKIQSGEKEVKIFGELVNVKCHVETVNGYSAHADQPTLLNWIKKANTKNSLKKVFVVQGEETSAKTLASLVHDRLDVEALAPMTGEAFELD